jgi:hypothetical protein
MADLHHYDTSTTSIIREDMDREGPATALIVLLILTFVGVLIWLFAFSGVAFNRSGGSPTNNIIQNPATTQTTQQQPISTPANNNVAPLPR